MITQADIRRSAVTSIPELLRMVPGLQVARVNGNNWVITARGFANIFAENLLVLIDGRSVYTPLFAGVYWDVQDTVLEDIERIEVIRGPGAALWGANAVNGVINIITKSAKDTGGVYARGGGGNVEQGFATARYGGTIGENAHYRGYFKYVNRDEFKRHEGIDANDDFEMFRGGWRVDWDVDENDLITFQGDIYSGDRGFTSDFSFGPFPPDVQDGRSRGGRRQRARPLEPQLLGTLGPRPPVLFRPHRAFRAHLRRGPEHLGPGFPAPRSASSSAARSSGGSATAALRTTPGPAPTSPSGLRAEATTSTAGFAQTQIPLLDDALRLTLGTKVEHNDYTGWEVQPNGRIAWVPNERHTLWGAVSRAVRTPSRANDDIQVSTATDPPSIVVLGDNDVESEDLLAFEIGYRVEPLDGLTFDLAAYYNRYRDLLTAEPTAEAGIPGGIWNRISNQMDGETYGFELAAQWRPTDWWHLRAGYTFLKVDFELDESSGDTLSEAEDRDSPRDQVQLFSYMDLPYDLQFDAAFYYVDNVNGRDVPSYTRFDFRLGWEPREDLELFVVLQNAFDAKHVEWSTDSSIVATRIPRSVFAGVSFRR